MVLETLMKLYVTDGFFEKKIFCSKNEGNGSKIGFFEFMKKSRGGCGQKMSVGTLFTRL